jgi:hypothetical protein
LTWNAFQSSFPRVAVDSNDNIHIVWEDRSSGPDEILQEIYYKRTTDGGLTWTAKRLSWNPDYSTHPCIATDTMGNIHVAWQDETPGNSEIFYRRSTNGGSTWGITKRLTWNSSFSEFPSITVDSNGYVHIVWENPISGNVEILYKRSTDGGATWGATKRLTWTTGYSERSSLVNDSNDEMHLIWTDNTPGNDEIFYMKSTDGGSTWTTAKRLTWNTGFSHSRKGCLSVDSLGRVHVVWHDKTPGNIEVFYKRSTNGGVTWEASKRLTWTSGDSCQPQITMDSNNDIHIVWYDWPPNNPEIYYKRSTNGGVSWFPSERLSWNSGFSFSPALAADSNNVVHVVWYDNTPGQSEIFYKKGKH